MTSKPLSRINSLLQIFVLSICVQFSFAQNPSFYSINSENGLPTNEVYRVIQDREGHIWIGSNSGIYSYNGFEFKNYSNTKQNGRALSFVQEDVKGRIWSKNFFGQIFKIENDVQKLVLDLQTSDPSYPQFTLDDNCNLYIYKGKTVIKHDENGKEISKLEINTIDENESIVTLFHFNKLLFGLTDKKRIFQIHCTSFKTFKEIKGKSTDEKVRSRSHFIAHRSKLYVFIDYFDKKINYSLNKINIEKGRLESIDFPQIDNDELIHGIYSDNKDLWIYGSNGAYRIKNPKERFFEGHKISGILKDNEEVLWFSSLDEGLFVLPNLDVRKINTSTNPLIENHFTYSKITNKNEAILGTYTGNLYLYNLSNQFIRPVFNKAHEQFLAVKKIETFDHYIIVSRGRLCIIDRTNGKQHFTEFSNVRDFCFRDDEMYLVFPQFIAKIKFSDLLKEHPVLKILNDNGGKEIEFDSKGKKMVVSQSNGTFWIDENDTWKEVKVNDQSVYASSLSYHSGKMWIGTISNGVLGFEAQNLITHYSTKNKISENVVLNVKATATDLWINTDQYVYRISHETGETNRFGRNLCVNPSDILNIEIAHNQIFLATNKAIYSFPTAIRLQNIEPARIKISRIESSGEIQSLKNKLVLESDNSNVKFFFSTLLLKNRGDYSVKYRLKGLSDRWEVANLESGYILFPKLPSGSYQFEIKTIDPFGKDSEIKRISLKVLTPFWNTLWFLTLCALAFIIFCIYIASLRIKFIKRKSEEKNKLIQSQLTALKSQMNPHFMFNTLNSLQDLMLKQDFKNTNYYLSKYASLLRMILTNSEKNEITIDEEITMLDAYLKLEKLRFGEDLTFEIKCSDEILHKNFRIPPMIIQPFVENAIKHGLLHFSGQKILFVHFYERGDKIICEIEDNGVGRKKSGEINIRQGKSYKSFSTEATDQRIKLMNEIQQKEYSVQIFDLEDSTEKTGTKVIISFAKIQ